MSYNTAIPQGTDPILQSQSQILSNFIAINSVWAKNHYSLTQPSEFQGGHNVLTMRPQSGDPTTDATHVSLYSKLDGSSIPQLFFRPISNQTPIQLTYSSLNTAISNTQYSFVAGPFVFYMGKIVGATDGQVINLLPVTTLIYVGTSAINVAVNVIPTNIIGASFTIKFPGTFSGSSDVSYIAIGKP